MVTYYIILPVIVLWLLWLHSTTCNTNSGRYGYIVLPVIVHRARYELELESVLSEAVLFVIHHKGSLS